MTSTEFALVATTMRSRLASWACKEVLLIVAAVILLGDPFGLLNMVGLSLVVSGVFLYKNEMMLRAQNSLQAGGHQRARARARGRRTEGRRCNRLPLHITIDEPATQLRGIAIPRSLLLSRDAELDAQVRARAGCQRSRVSSAALRQDCVRVV